MRSALPLGDDCEAVGDVKEATGKKGDVVVAIGAVPRARPGADRLRGQEQPAVTARGAAPSSTTRCASATRDFAVLVVPSEDKVPARMHALREYNGDKLIVAYDADEGPLALQVAYSLARARVLMARGGGEGVDAAAVRRHRRARRWASSRRSGASANSSPAPRPRSTRHLTSWAP